MNKRWITLNGNIMAVGKSDDDFYCMYFDGEMGFINTKVICGLGDGTVDQEKRMELLSSFFAGNFVKDLQSNITKDASLLECKISIFLLSDSFKVPLLDFPLFRDYDISSGAIIKELIESNRLKESDNSTLHEKANELELKIIFLSEKINLLAIEKKAKEEMLFVKFAEILNQKKKKIKKLMANVKDQKQDSMEEQLIEEKHETVSVPTEKPTKPSLVLKPFVKRQKRTPAKPLVYEDDDNE